MAELDRKWYKVNEDNFNPHKFKAHGDFQTTIKNHLKSKSLQEQVQSAMNPDEEEVDDEEEEELVEESED